MFVLEFIKSCTYLLLNKTSFRLFRTYSWSKTFLWPIHSQQYTLSTLATRAKFVIVKKIKAKFDWNKHIILKKCTCCWFFHRFKQRLSSRCTSLFSYRPCLVTCHVYWSWRWSEHEPIIHVERGFIIKRLVKKVSVFVNKLEKSTLKNICCYQYTSIEKSG